VFLEACSKEFGQQGVIVDYEDADPLLDGLDGRERHEMRYTLPHFFDGHGRNPLLE